MGSEYMFVADTDFNPAVITSSPTDIFVVGNSILNTDDDALYRTHRYTNNAAKTLSYTLYPAYTGTYEVTLHFAETYLSGSGKRIFDVNVNGVLLADDYDVFAAAGAMFTATNLTTSVNVAAEGDTIVILLTSSKQKAMISGIAAQRVKDVPILQEMPL